MKWIPKRFLKAVAEFLGRWKTIRQSHEIYNWFDGLVVSGRSGTIEHTTAVDMVHRIETKCKDFQIGFVVYYDPEAEPEVAWAVRTPKVTDKIGKLKGHKNVSEGSTKIEAWCKRIYETKMKMPKSSVGSKKGCQCDDCKKAGA